MFEKYEQIQLEDGITYLYIGTITMDNRNFHFLSPKSEDRYILGELVEKDGKRFFAETKDPEIVRKVRKYYTDHPDSLK